jgi:formiminotetrahydrofolate cyclodeaminase
MQVKQEHIGDFLDELASASATPGGGSAAALTGAMGAALVSMVCNVTIGKRGFVDVEQELQGVRKESERLRHRLLALAEADSEAFDQVMAAYRLPKETDGERAARKVAIQYALKQATQVPLETATACAAVLGLIDQVLPKINPNALSDGGAAALLAEAGMQGAQLNVIINLADIHDADFTGEKQHELDDVLQKVNGAKERVFSYVLRHL